MKKLILLALLSLNLFAGDLYLSCFDREGNTVAETSIDKDKKTTQLSFNDMRTDRYTLDLTLHNKDSRLTIQIYEMNSGLLMEEREELMDMLKPVSVSLGYSCVIID